MPDAICDIPIECKGDTAEVLVYDFIGKSFFEEGLTAKSFAENLKAMGKGIKTINVRINSPGGSVFDGTAIYNTLRNHGAKVVTHIEGGALSIASLIAMAGDERRMAKNAYFMIHDPVNVVRGGSEDMRKGADLLDRVKETICSTYAERSGHDKDAIAQLMTAETWMNATDAKELGFVTDLADETGAIAAFDPAMFAKVPAEILNSLSPKEPPVADTPKAATIKELRAACPGADEKFILAQLENESPIASAQSAWMTELSTRNAALVADNAKLKTAPPPAAPAPQDGVDPLPAGGAPSNSGGEPIDEFSEEVQNVMKKTGKSRHDAHQIVCRTHPELREAMVAAHNVKFAKVRQVRKSA